MSVEGRVIKCIADQAGCEVSDLEMYTHFSNDLYFDNLDFMELLMLFDHEFDSFWDVDSYLENCYTVKGTLEWVKYQLSEGN